jgi:hypothetical protein
MTFAAAHLMKCHFLFIYFLFHSYGERRGFQQSVRCDKNTATTTRRNGSNKTWNKRSAIES